MDGQFNITTARLHGLHVGDRLRMIGFSNRFRHWIDAIVTATEVSGQQYIRPSKGFRKHIRARKALAREKGLV
jgi:hypothetical protein